MKFRREGSTAFFILVSSLLLPISARPQTLTGKFYPEKGVYLVGEPVFIDFEISNTGEQSAWISQRMGEPCTGRDPIEVVGAKQQRSVGAASTCSATEVSDGCIQGLMELKAGEKHIERIFLSARFRLDHAEVYQVQARRRVPVSTIEVRGSAIFKFAESPTTMDFSSDFQITLVDGTAAELEAAFQPYVRVAEGPEPVIQGPEIVERFYAIWAITEIAPPFLEGVILKLADTPNVAVAAILALARLNTPKAKQKLVDLAEHSTDESVQDAAIGALVTTRDQTYFPLLDHMARDSTARKRASVARNAGFFGDNAVPLLVSLLSDVDTGVRYAAATGLGVTASRSAVGPLIGAFNDPGLFWPASRSLAQLTHRSITTRPDLETPSAEASRRWVTWWSKNGLTAPIYSPDKCEQLQTLD
jgi:hypothetical protein